MPGPPFTNDNLHEINASAIKCSPLASLIATRSGEATTAMPRWLWPPKCFPKKSIYATGHVGTFSRMVSAVVLIVGELLVI